MYEYNLHAQLVKWSWWNNSSSAATNFNFCSFFALFTVEFFFCVLRYFSLSLIPLTAHISAEDDFFCFCIQHRRLPLKKQRPTDKPTVNCNLSAHDVNSYFPPPMKDSTQRQLSFIIHLHHHLSCSSFSLFFQTRLIWFFMRLFFFYSPIFWIFSSHWYFKIQFFTKTSRWFTQYVNSPTPRSLTWKMCVSLSDLT